MNFTLSEDHLALRDAARTFLSKEVKLEPYLRTEANVKPVERDGLWQAIQGLGWPGMVILALRRSYHGRPSPFRHRGPMIR